MLFDIDSGGAKYEIQKSLRFRSSASAYLSRTPTVAGNRKTWTWSGWVKRGSLGVYQALFTAFNGSTNNDGIAFTAANKIELYSAGAAAAYRITTAVYRDPSSWYHVVVATDTPNATAQNRARIWVNGGEITAWDTNAAITQNSDWFYNSTNIHNIARYQAAGNFDGYLSEVNFIDGQALDASYFGEFSAETGAWIPKKYTGTYGTNGFYLPFNDGSSLANLTADRSGNGNNWVANNISLTSGSSYDWMDDTPTNNFAVLNPIGSYPGAIRAGNLSTNIAGINTNANSSIGVSAGKWYWEVNGNTPGCNGVVNTAFPFWYAWIPGQDANSVGYYSGGTKYENGSHTAYGAAYGAADIVGMALDMDAGTLTCYKNGVSQGVLKSGLTGVWFPSVGANDVYTQHANFGQRPFAYAPPTGFKALCTKNLHAPSILNPKKHFDVRTHIGNNTTTQITGVQFSPDFAWVKCRSNVASNILMDSIRGAGRLLISDSTTGEAGNVGDLITSFNSDGITVNGTFLGSGNASTNGLNYTYVDWLWKAGGATVANNAGSIASQVSANQQAGFSIVTYTGTGANATVGHGLGVAPKMVIVKNRNTAGQSWLVWHTNLLGSEYLLLESTAAKATAATPWNNTTPTISVFSVGASSSSNENTKNLVAYCFAEIPGYSKIGSYTGNGSADGPFVYCGFRPRYVMVKCSSAGGVGYSWFIRDSERNTYNAVRNSVFSDSSSSELPGGGAYDVDFISSGFKVRGSEAGLNTSGGTYIFYAVAEQPFQFANAR